MSLSDTGFFDTFKEAGAMAKHVASAKGSSASQLIRRVAEVRGTGFGITTSAAEVESETIEALRAAGELLRSKEADEFDAYRTFVLDFAHSVSTAAGGGDQAEAAAIGKIESALGEG